MFQQRHYVAVAKLLKESKVPLDAATMRSQFLKGALAEWNVLQSQLSDLFKSDNPKFDVDIFDRACGRDA